MNTSSKISQDLPDIGFFVQKYQGLSDFSHIMTDLMFKKKYGTRLNNGIIHYLNRFAEKNENLTVLDLGCGSGGNSIYLNRIGIKNVISLDIRRQGANIIGNALTLPFKANSFDLIISTALIEHLIDPFLAFNEMARVLRKESYLLATVSFWERWHDKSCFHFTPNGIYILCRHSGLELLDLWPGWGFIESIMSHAIGHALQPLGTLLQRIFNTLLGIVKGNDAVIKHRLRTSGSFGFIAKNIPRQNKNKSVL